MKSDLLSLARVIGVTLLLFIVRFSYAQNTVGIGVTDPNPNAVLELVSPDHNQGLLVPRVTTLQRTANSFVDKLSAIDKGLFVFDTDVNSLYFWNGASWTRVDTPEILQDLELTGTSLKITNNPNATAISLAPFLGTNTDEQTLALTGNSLSISNGNTIDLSSLQDGFEANTDNQTLNVTGSSLSISGGNTVNLSSIDTDDQTLNLSGANLSITGGNSVDLSSIDTNTQLSEAEVDAFVSNNGFISTEIDGSITNEIQNISSTGAAGNISISSGSTLNLNVNDADANPINEIQDLSLTGNILTITNNGSATPIDLSPFSGTNTDNQTISLSGTNLSITGGNTVDISSVDTDTDDQVLNLAGSTLSITDGNSVNLSSVNTDNQTLGITGNTLSITGGNNVNLGGIDTDDQTLSLSGTNLSIAGGNTIDISSVDTNTQLDEIAVDAFVANNGYLTAEVDGSITNEIQDLNLTGNILTITNNGSATPIDLSPFSGTNTDNQTISLSGTSLSIAGGNTIDIGSIDTDTQLDEAAVDAFVSNNGYLTAEVDGSITNEIQDLTFTSGVIALSNDPGSTTIDLSGYDNNVADDFNGDFAALSNIPAGLTDGDDVGITSVTHNTTLTGNGNGTPLAVNVGTGANQIVQLNASGQLPAVNGSLLTGLPTSPWTGSPDLSYSAGRVGIGTNSPFNQLSVSGTNTTPSVSDGIMLDIQNISGIGGTLSGIRFKKNGVTANQRFNSGIFYNGDELMFSIKDNSTATNVSTNDAAMTLTNQGRVGIGTKTPGSMLTVLKNEAGSTLPSLNILEANGTSDASMTFETQGGSSFAIGVDASDAHKFKMSTNNALGVNDRLTILGAGNVGVGTSSPLTNYQLEIETTFTGGLYIDNNATSGNNYGVVTSMNALASGTRYGFYATGEDRNYFSGDVGIGTTVPSAKLDVNGDAELNGETRLNGNLVSAVTADHITGTNESLPTPTRRILRVTSNVNNRGIEYIGAGQDGQELIIIHSGNGGSGFATNIIFYRSGTGGAGITVTPNSLYMSGGSTYSLNAGSSIHFIYDGTLQAWVEISRSTNIIAIN
ncbi:MAG TPA: hypothetical protein PKN99_07620 [Cyclobacteriaceae bacterium]|nr:hypothetical protein [Cyclobacteriaceae bacterium]